MAKLWEKREGHPGKLFIQTTDDWLRIVESNNLIPEQIICTDNTGLRLVFRQVSPWSYVFVKEEPR